ncbi:MAG: dihydrofolate reductase [Pirellulales bacterium]|nr:dihydrofolate reductase [Pirellulales bacterium]
MSLSIIVAFAENGVIGRDGALPWHLSADLQRFKRLTMGHTIIMGRRTWESIGRPLPGRTSMVISRQAHSRPEQDKVLWASSLDAALADPRCAREAEAFVIGGAMLYEEALPIADRLYVTRVRAQVPGETYFPEVVWNMWQLVEEQTYPPDARNDYSYSFQVYQRA